MKLVKHIYIGLIVVYFLGIAIFFLKGEIAYKMVGVNPTLLYTRSLTKEEYYALKDSDAIILSIGKNFFIFSIFMSIISYFAIDIQLVKPLIVIKIFYRICLFFSILLFLVYNANFISPGRII
jgi:hypothetical protein